MVSLILHPSSLILSYPAGFALPRQAILFVFGECVDVFGFCHLGSHKLRTSCFQNSFKEISENSHDLVYR